MTSDRRRAALHAGPLYPANVQMALELLEAGARVFEYDRTMLHAKVLVIDDQWVNIGSGNFDSRSLDLDLEINVALFDPDLVAQLSGHFLEDLQVSREIDLQAWRKRPLRTRAAEIATELIRQSCDPRHEDAHRAVTALAPHPRRIAAEGIRQRS